MKNTWGSSQNWKQCKEQSNSTVLEDKSKNSQVLNRAFVEAIYCPYWKNIEQRMITCKIRVPIVTCPWRALVVFFSIKNFKTWKRKSEKQKSLYRRGSSINCVCALKWNRIRLLVSSCHTTAVEDIERKAPTKIPSEALPPHNCKIAYNQNRSNQRIIWKSPLVHVFLKKTLPP